MTYYPFPYQFMPLCLSNHPEKNFSIINDIFDSREFEKYYRKRDPY